MENCTICGTEMTVMIQSSFCPECEKNKPKTVADHRPEIVHTHDPSGGVDWDGLIRAQAAGTALPITTKGTTHSSQQRPGAGTMAATTAPLCSQREALRWCEKIEAAIEPMGWHVGLTGGCLYKKGPRKDIDFIIYPHIIHGSMNYTDQDILDVVKTIGCLLGYYGSDIKKSAHYKDGKLLFKLGDDVDVFVFGT